jgi:uncharacterized protein YggE
MYYPQPYFRSAMMNRPRLSQDQNVIKVTGEGMVSIQPDTALITLGVITESKQLGEAQKENSEAINNMIDSLLDLDIPRENIRTVDYRVDVQYDYVDGKQIFRGYRITHLLQVTNDQIDQTGQIVDTAISSGANSVSNIQFTVEQSEAFYLEALAIAIQTAHQKAATIAREIGVTLVSTPYQVQEVTQRETPTPYPAVLQATTEATSIEPGETTISALIKADFSYL